MTNPDPGNDSRLVAEVPDEGKGKVGKIPGSSGGSGMTVRMEEDSQGSPDHGRSAGTCMPSQEKPYKDGPGRWTKAEANSAAEEIQRIVLVRAV